VLVRDAVVVGIRAALRRRRTRLIRALVLIIRHAVVVAILDLGRLDRAALVLRRTRLRRALVDIVRHAIAVRIRRRRRGRRRRLRLAERKLHAEEELPVEPPEAEIFLGRPVGAAVHADAEGIGEVQLEASAEVTLGRALAAGEGVGAVAAAAEHTEAGPHERAGEALLVEHVAEGAVDVEARYGDIAVAHVRRCERALGLDADAAEEYAQTAAEEEAVVEDEQTGLLTEATETAERADVDLDCARRRRCGRQRSKDRGCQDTYVYFSCHL